MKKILITGFEPFGGEAINPSLEAVKQLHGRQLKGGVVVSCQVPVVRFAAIDAVISAIETHKPDYVMTIGQAAGRAGITPERVAINVDDFRIPDNGNIQVIDEPIATDGPAAYFSTLPIKAMTLAMRERGIPAQVSNSAGTFVCNHLFYGIQHYLRDTAIGHGFIHIPLLPEQVLDGEQPSLSLEMIIEGLAICAQATLDHPVDIKQGAGSIC